MKWIKHTFLLLVALLFVQCSMQKTTWNVNDYGAKGDSTTLNTEAIQQAIEACYQAGGGTVVLESGVYLSGTILLKDNVTLEVKQGATLLGSRNPYHYQCVDAFTDATGQYRGECLVGAINASNIAICGEGTIEGQGDYFYANKLRETFVEAGIDVAKVKEMVHVRPFLVRLVGSKGVTISDITMRQPAAWTCHLFECKNIVINNTTIFSHVNRNNDGIDFDSCDGAEVYDCDIDTGDDALCFKATSPVACQNIRVRNCRLKSDWGAIKFGTEAMGDFHNITVEDCLVHDTKGGGLKILSVDGSNISDLTIQNIQMDSVDMPIFIRLGERLRTYRNAPVQPVGSIKGVKIANITATQRPAADSRVNPPAGIFITGTPNHFVESVSLKNIAITLPGGGLAEHATIVPPEDIDRYPEFNFFGILPAYGLNARCVEKLEVENLTFTLAGSDERPEEKLFDVKNLIKK